MTWQSIGLAIGGAITALAGFFGIADKPSEPLLGATTYQVWQGGTGFSSARQGELLTGSADHNLTLSKIATGSIGQVLTMSAGLPSWQTPTTGTVTSVAQTVPTGFSISGSPVTTNGTLAISFASGYSLPLTASQSAWELLKDGGPYLTGNQTITLSGGVTGSGATSIFTTVASESFWDTAYNKRLDSASGTVPIILTLSNNALTQTLTAGYSIALTASQTAWEAFRDTPSTRITDGTGLTWSTNTLNVDDIYVLTGGDTMTGNLIGTGASFSAGEFTSYASASLFQGSSFAGVPLRECSGAGDTLNWELGLFTCGTDSGGSPGGSDTHVQFNDATAFGGVASFTFSKTLAKLSLDGNASISSNLEVVGVASISSFRISNPGIRTVDNFYIGKSNIAEMDNLSGPGSQNAFGARASANTTAANDFAFAIGIGAEARNCFAFGNGASCSATTNNSAIAVGNNVFSTGRNATVFGVEARATGANCISMGNTTLCTSTSGIAFGFEASVSGAQATAIGANAECAFADSIGLGQNTSCTAINQFRVGGYANLKDLELLGTASISGLFYLPGISTATGNDLCINATTKEVTDAGGVTCGLSSIRFKENVEPLPMGALEKIMLLRPVSFNFKPEIEPSLSNTKKKVPHIGLIAEEMEEVESRLVFYEPDGTTPRGIAYEEYTALLTKAIQELNAKNVALETRLTDLEARVALLDGEEPPLGDIMQLESGPSFWERLRNWITNLFT